MSPRARGSAATLGVALTPTSVTAAGRSMPTVWRRDIELNGGANGSLEQLQAALADAARASGTESPSTVVALLSPLVELRSIALPPLGEADRNRFLTRNASRYFVSARGAQVVGSQAPVVAKGAPAGPVLAAAAAQQLIGAVQAAATAANLSLVGVVPAESAWAAAAVEIWPALARGSAGVVVTRDDRTDLITIADGEVQAVRRFRGPGDAAEIVAAVDSSGGGARIGVLGPAAAAIAMTAALNARGARVSSPDGQWRAMSEHPEALAARFAPAASGLEIRTEESRENERAESGRLARWALALAAVVLIIAGLAHYLGVKRELASVQAARAAIRPRVDAMLVGRSSVETAYRQVAGLARISRESPRWSSVLAALAAQLPDAASLTAFRARGDSIFLDGVAEQAAPIFDDVARTPGVTGVRATAPVRRESPEGEAPLEHFAIGAQIAPRQAPAAASATARRPR
jgi:hypothetical protein